MYDKPFHFQLLFYNILAYLLQQIPARVQEEACTISNIFETIGDGGGTCHSSTMLGKLTSAWLQKSTLQHEDIPQLIARLAMLVPYLN